MHRSSPSIAAIASALAKAQGVLVNPEKTLTATIRDDKQGRRTERSFRYAPLSAGLELARKALGQHEIALVQTTAIDEASRTVRLNSVLAHSSGEWIASDWPVCPMSDMNSPQRMGAALTYARRHALFALVGIAGEDDLDAPDLNAPNSGPVTAETATSSTNTVPARPHSGNGRVTNGLKRSQFAAPNRPILAGDESARLREGMLAEIEGIASSTAATAWANTMLRAKNTLTANDARAIESAFETKIAGLPADVVADGLLLPVVSHGDDSVAPHDAAIESVSATRGSINERNPPIAKTVRHRNKEHLQFVRTQPCLICAKQPSDPHHLPFAQPRALGRKVSDQYTVPLCRAHHREVHRAAQEIGWWQSVGIAPLAVAEALWQESQSGHALNEPRPLAKSSQSRRPQILNGNADALEKQSPGDV
jgi:hypothetical protein